MLKKPIILPEGYPFIGGMLFLAILLSYLDMIKLAVLYLPAILLTSFGAPGETIKSRREKIRLFLLLTAQ